MKPTKSCSSISRRAPCATAWNAAWSTPREGARALDNFFTEANLTALRELAIRHTAHEVEEKLFEPHREERILICLTGRPSSANLIRRGKRVADYLQADCLAVHVCTRQPSAMRPWQRHMSFARNLRIQTHVLEGEDVPRSDRRASRVPTGSPRSSWAAPARAPGGSGLGRLSCSRWSVWHATCRSRLWRSDADKGTIG